MKSLHTTAGTGKHQVEITALLCGSDINICILGGTHPHIGASALGLPRASLKDPNIRSASVSVLTVTGHKEDELVRDAATRITSTCGCITSVQAGLHIDNATMDDIQLLCINYGNALGKLEKNLQEVYDGAKGNIG